MIFSCLPCLSRQRFIYTRPRRINRHHRRRLYDVPDFDALPLPTPIFVPPSPPPPYPDLPLPIITPPAPEEPLGPFPLIHYRPRSISPPPIPIQGQPLPYPVFVPYPEPVIYREIVPYLEPILYRVLSNENLSLNYLPTMISGLGGYGSNLRTDDIQVAVEAAVDLVLSELRTSEWRDRFQPFRNGYLNRNSTIGNLEIDEYIRRMNLLVQIANHTVTAINYHGEVQPKIADSGTDAGKYPRDFERPRRVGDFYTMDVQTLDRILRAYNLPADYLGRSSLSSPLRLGGGYGGSEHEREEKVRALFEFLGVDTRDPGLSSGLSSGLGGGLGGGLLSFGRRGLGGGLGGPLGRRIGSLGGLTYNGV